MDRFPDYHFRSAFLTFFRFRCFQVDSSRPLLIVCLYLSLSFLFCARRDGGNEPLARHLHCYLDGLEWHACFLTPTTTPLCITAVSLFAAGCIRRHPQHIELTACAHTLLPLLKQIIRCWLLCHASPKGTRRTRRNCSAVSVRTSPTRCVTRWASRRQTWWGSAVVLSPL